MLIYSKKLVNFSKITNLSSSTIRICSLNFVSVNFQKLIFVSKIPWIAPEATHRLPIVRCADCDSPKCAHVVINKHWILFLSHHHACRTSASCQTSCFCLHIIYSLSRHHSKFGRQLQPKQTRHVFKVQIRIKFVACLLGEIEVIFQIFCSPKAKSSRHWRSVKGYLNP